MRKPQRKNQDSLPLTEARLEKLLSEQTSVILEAVDKRLTAQEVRFNERLSAQEIRFNDKLESRLSAQEVRFNSRLEKLESRFMQKLDDLTTTLDKFLKRVTDVEDEFVFLKEDLRRVKAVIREKLGVSLD
jgi:hypothetical protein